MKKSFKVHLFMHVILITFLVIFVNRVTAQYFLTDQLQTRIHHEMGMALKTCEKNFHQRDVFLNCFKAIEKGSLFSNISDFYVLCDKRLATVLAGKPNGCQSLPSDEDFWHGKGVSSDGYVEFSQGLVNETSWYAVRLKDQQQGPEIWLESSQVDALMQRVWALRDRNTIYVLPAMFAMLTVLTFYLIYIVMRPLVSIQNNMSKLTANTLDQSTILQAPFKEFDMLVNVFEDLRIRLNDSFTKARRFASDASHELRTPLTILRGNVERLIHDLPLGSHAQIRVRSMGDEVERLIEITEKLLLLSRADANSLMRDVTAVNFSELISTLIKDAHSFQPSLKITSAIAPNVIWCCDKTLVQQLVLNLYANAVNYNQPSGWVHFGLVQRDDFFQLTVENPTTDIPSDLSERAFDRFYRGDASHTRQVDGLGLGLSICMEIAKLHQATVSLSVTNKKTVVATLTATLRRFNRAPI